MTPTQHSNNHPEPVSTGGHQGCHPATKKIDWLLWGSLLAIAILYFYALLITDNAIGYEWLGRLSSSVFVLMNTVWWGILAGIIMVALLSRIPRAFVIAVLGRPGGLRGIIRATAAGVLLDLCSHGILMVGAKLYERGASIGQVMAFLIASPWNSFSLTLILFALIGLKWTLAFIVLSMLIAMSTGILFEWMVTRGLLPDNAQQADLPADFRFWFEAKKGLTAVDYSAAWLASMLMDGIKGSRMVMRWIFFGVLLAGLIRTFVSPEHFGSYFGPTLAGLGLTVLAATIIEVCSEGSTPLAADLLTRANAPGNSFAFLMTGVSTDYTEVMVIKETTRSWSIALLLPLITVPQIVLIGWLINISNI